MALDLERRQADRRRVRGPAHVLVLRGQIIDHHMDDQVDWHEVAEAAKKIADFARSRQAQAWKRVRSWDPEAAC